MSPSRASQFAFLREEAVNVERSTRERPIPERCVTLRWCAVAVSAGRGVVATRRARRHRSFVAFGEAARSISSDARLDHVRTGPRHGNDLGPNRSRAGGACSRLALGVAFDKAWPPSILDALTRAQGAWREGKIEIRNAYRAPESPRLVGEPSGYRLYVAACLLDRAFITPFDLMKIRDLDTAGSRH